MLWRKLLKLAGGALTGLLIIGLGVRIVVAAQMPTPLYGTNNATVPLNKYQMYATYPQPDYGTGAQKELIQKGEYLAKLGDCIACHTNPTEGGAAFAGGLPIKTPFGTFYSPNITADPDTGIGKWTDRDFIRAMQEGMDPKSKNYFPVFPYPYFHKVHKDDLLAIKAYLFSIPKVKQANKGNTLPFPMNWRFLQWGWKMMFFYPYRSELKYDPSKSPEWNRGAYLVEGLGHCAMCHTPMNSLGAPKHAYHMTGGFIDGFWAPNITRLGLHKASVEEVVSVFKHNQLINNAGKVVGPMADVNHDSLRYLTDADLKAMAVYLMSIESPKEMDFAKALAKEKDSAIGRTVFYEKCAMCHGQGSEHNIGSAPVIGDEANWSERLKQGLPILYRRTINGFNGMPPMGNCVTCSEANIRSAVNYLIAHSVSTADVQRVLAKPKPMKLTKEDGKWIYNKACASCHDTGKDGAPKRGDKEAWKPLIAKNIDTLINYTIRGKDNKHVRGRCDSCSNAELIAATKYLIEESKSDGDYSLW